MRKSAHTPAKVALITGGATRVGRAIVKRFAAAGYNVAFTYLNSVQEAAQLATILHAAGQPVLPIRADLTRPTQACRIIFQNTLKKFGRLDVMINNASLYEPGDLDQTTLPPAQRLMAIHFHSPLLLCQAFAPFLRKHGGHIINMLDLLAERPWKHYLAYCASKAALWNLTLSLAAELAPQVTVNGIAPGVILWPEDYPVAQQRKYLARVPLRRAGTPGDVAELAHFLATEGSYITGQIIRVDGGKSIT